MKITSIILISILLALVMVSCAPPQAPLLELSEQVIENIPKVMANPEPVSEESQKAIPNTNTVPTDTIAKTISFSWQKDNGPRLEDGSVPFVHKLSDGKVRLYYCNSKGILSS